MTSKSSIETLVADTKRSFGSVDILINNAALFADLSKKPFQEIEDEEWDRVMAVNVRGPFECAKAARAHDDRTKVREDRERSLRDRLQGLCEYDALRDFRAVVAMTRCLARELGPYNICVNAIAPGLTMSEAVIANREWTGAANTGTVASRAIRRDQTPSDLLCTLLYLCSDDSNFMTGQTIVLDGGSVMR